MSETMTALNEALLSKFKQETLILLSTIDHENGGPSTSAISWVHAVDASTIRFAVDQRSRIVSNIKADDKVNITLFADQSVFVVYGTASIVTDALEDVPFKLTCVDITIDAVRDSMFYGARISVEPEYEKTYDKRAAEKLDSQVFDAMKKA